MRRPVALSAALLAAGAAFGQDTAPDPTPAQIDAFTEMPGNLIRTRDISGGDIYVRAVGVEDWDPSALHYRVSPDWSRAGTVEDIVDARSATTDVRIERL